MKNRLPRVLGEIKEKGNYRTIRYVKPLSTTRILYESKEYLNLCSNSYLSLHDHPYLVRAAQKALDVYGAGTCSSRSVSGSIDLYKVLEEEIAAYKGYHKGLIFSTGYMANMAIVATLTGEDDIIFSDSLNHSSLIDSMRLSRAKKVVFRHKDMNDLEEKIKKEDSKGTRFVITESVFSMDGDVAPIDDIIGFKEKYGVHIILDDAHGTGVFGEKGRGGEEIFGFSGKMDVQMATFGKAFGSFGAFVVGDEIVIDYLVNRARTFMYTTGLPPSSLGASIAAVRLVRDNISFKDELWENIGYMRSHLKAAGFDLKESEGPIIPIVVGDDSKTIKMQEMLMEKGLFIQAIRPPTVPRGTSRLRLTVVRGLAKDEMEYAVAVLIDVGREMRLI
ncbi:MAG: 8-amino-7-oxononanoate synthase [Syntrophus sp. (in: bacteria)]|nr:8-amino-7-oxononanoate synthase [Syntrophus sp. (in: bacteria)]